jgi:hypothetical protein
VVDDAHWQSNGEIRVEVNLTTFRKCVDQLDSDPAHRVLEVRYPTRRKCPSD